MLDHLASPDNLAIIIFICAVSPALLLPRPERSPPYLGPWPWQFMAALGAAALIVAQCAMAGLAAMPLARLEATDIKGGLLDGLSIIVLLAWLGASILTLVLAFVFIIRHARRPRLADKPPPDDLAAFADDAMGLLGASRAYARTRLAVRWTMDPGYAIEVRRQGRHDLVIVLRKSLKRWLGRLSSAAERMAFQRFIVFHELGHYLNGDHKTANVVVAVMTAHIPFLVFTIAGVPVGILAAALAHDPDFTSSVLLYQGFGLAICVLALAERMLLARFIAERERRADLRARFSLSAEDHDLMFSKGSRSSNLLTSYIALEEDGGHDPAGTPPLLARLWNGLPRFMLPQGNAVSRAAHLNTEPAFPSVSRRVLWGGVFGAQIGVLWMAGIVFGASAVVILDLNEMDLNLVILLSGLVAALAPSIYFIAATEPARIRLVSNTARRAFEGAAVTVGIIVSAVTVASLLFGLAVLGLHFFSGETAHGGSPIVGGAVILAGMIAIGCFLGWFTSGGDSSGPINYDNGASAPWRATVLPFVIAAFPVTLPVGGSLYYASGLVDAWHFGFGFAVLLGLLPFLAMTALNMEISKPYASWSPFGYVPSSDPVIGVRILWRNYYADRTRSSYWGVATTTGLLSASMLGTLAGIAAMAWGGMAIIGDGDLVLGHLVALTLGGMVLLLVAFHKPRRLHALSAQNLMTFAKLHRLASQHKDSGLARRAGAFEKGLVEALSLDQTWDALLPRADAPERLKALTFAVDALHLAGREDVLELRRRSLQDALRSILTPENFVSSWPGGPPSLIWTAHAAKLAWEARLFDTGFRAEIADTLERLAEQSLAEPNPNSRSNEAHRRHELLQAVRVLADLNRIPCAVKGSGRILNDIDAGGFYGCGLSPGDVAYCLRMAETSRSSLHGVMKRIIRERAWALLHGNLQINLLPALDCLEAASILRLSPEEMPHGLENLLDKSLAVTLKQDLHDINSSSM